MAIELSIVSGIVRSVAKSKGVPVGDVWKSQLRGTMDVDFGVDLGLIEEVISLVPKVKEGKLKLSVDDCISIAAAAPKSGVSIRKLVGVRLAVRGKSRKSLPPKEAGSKFKFVQQSGVTGKFRAEVRLDSRTWIIDQHFATEAEAVDAVVKATGLQPQCLLALKDVKLSKEAKEFMFL